MNGRFELKRRGQEYMRGNRFSALPAAVKALSHAVPAGEWFVWDRLERREVAA